MKKLKYGIIGCGGIGNVKHLPGYSQLKDEVEIIAACDVNEKILKDTADKYEIPNIFTDYKKLLGMKDIDFISICLPNYLHAPITIEALNAGKHIHCEKPMAANIDEAQKMIDEKNKTGKLLMIGLNNRFTQEALYVKKLVKSGFLGEIYHAKCGWVRRAGLPPLSWFTERRHSGGGALIDLGVLFIDLVLYFMDYYKVRSVTAKAYRKFGGTELNRAYVYKGFEMATGVFDVEDMAIGIIELTNDASISFEISWAANIEKEKKFYELYGTKAGIRFVEDDTGGKLEIFTTVNGQMANIIPEINPLLNDESEFSHFVNCIRNNKEPTISVTEQAMEMIRIIGYIYESATTQKQVMI